MSSERNIWGDLPADPRALRLSIAELERAEGLCLHEIEDEVSYLESVDLVLHEVKRRRWRPIDTVPRDHFPRLVWSPAIGRCVAFLDVTWAWWPVPATEPLPSAPTHWMPLGHAPCDGSGEAGETEGLATKCDSAVDEASSEVEAPTNGIMSELTAQKAAHDAISPDLKFLQAQIQSLTTALAENERKRVEADTVSVPRLCDVEALFAYYAVMDAGQRCHERTIGAINAYVAEAARLASTPTQETPDDQG